MIYLYDDSGNGIDLKQYGLKCLSFIPESLSPNFETDNIENVDRSIILGTTINPRKLYAKFLFQAADHVDYQLLRDDIFRLFNPKKDLYIIDLRQRGKRWKARNSSVFKPEYITASTGKFELEFLANEVYSESLGTTLDPLTFDAELWQIGQGLSDEDKTYIQTATSFSIFNAGDITLDPRKQPLVIKYKGTSNNLQIKNKTTGETWSYTGATASADTLEINGTRSLKNGASVFGDTNHQLITLAQGWNDFELTGTSGSFSISFDFRFYYV
jgi:hypothetical protein